MEYTVSALSKLAGVSSRTLRYYDEIGLLRPCRVNSSGYRLYGQKEVDRLQQIMFFKKMGFELSVISDIMGDPTFNRIDALKRQLLDLKEKRRQLDILTLNIEKTIEKEEGKLTMIDKEKFEGLKKQLIENNEKKYGDEIRQKYGSDAVEKSNQRFQNLTAEQYEAMQAMSEKLHTILEKSIQDGVSPEGEIGREVTELHKNWLLCTWAEYSPEAHRGLAQMYVADKRFTAYYDERVEGCARFLHDAIHAWAK